MYESQYSKLGRYVKAAVKGQANRLSDFNQMAKAADDINMGDHIGASSFLVSTRAVIETAGESSVGLIHVPEPESVFFAAGGQFFNPPFSSQLNVPRPKVSPEFLAMTDSPADSQLSSHENVVFKPNRLMTYLDIAKNILSMSDEAVGRKIYEGMENRCMELIDKAAFGIQERTAIMPQGMGYACTSGIDTAVEEITPVSIAPIKAMIQELVAAKGWKSPVFITSPSGAVILQTTPVASGSDRFVMENGKILNIPVFVSENVSDEAGTGGTGSLLMLASMKNVAATMFGTWQITVDHLTLARNNTVRLILQSYWDIAGLNGSVATDGTPETPGEPESQPFEYSGVVACAALIEPVV